MNNIDEFLEVALAIFLAIAGLMFLLTYRERSLLEPVEKPNQSVAGRRGARAVVQEWWLRRRRSSGALASSFYV